MYKANVELFSVRPNFKVKFSLILKEDLSDSRFRKEVVNKIALNGNEYMQVTPYPFIVFDITNRKQKKENGFSAYDSMTFNRKHLFIFLKKVSYLLKNFSNNELFYYENDVLKVNKELSKKMRVIHRTNTRTILLQPIVVVDDTDNKEYEGVLLAINSLDHSVEITYTELQFLYHELNKIDFTSYSLQLINMKELFVKMEPSEIKFATSTMEEKKTEELIDRKKNLQKEHEMPEI